MSDTTQFYIACLFAGLLLYPVVKSIIDKRKRK